MNVDIYISKPSRVWAIQWDATDETFARMADTFPMDVEFLRHDEKDSGGGDYVEVETPVGPAYAYPGDWVLYTGAALFVSREETFAERYTKEIPDEPNAD